MYYIDDIEELNSEAGSQLRSQELKAWGEQPNVNMKLIVSPPYRQDQKGLSKSHWQECRKIAFNLLCQARLNLRFFDPALIHGSRIHNVLPLKRCMVTTPDGDTIPSNVFAFYSKKPNVARYRVFCCPASAKVYRFQESDTGGSLDSRTLVQRGPMLSTSGSQPIRPAGSFIAQPQALNLSVPMFALMKPFSHHWHGINSFLTMLIPPEPSTMRRTPAYRHSAVLVHLQ